MKHIGIVLVIIILSLTLIACNNKATAQNSLEIYIISGDLPDSETIDLNNLNLEKTPVLTLDDIQKYYWEEQTFILKKDLLTERLGTQPGKVPVPTTGLPYVVVVNGERIYMGKFWTGLSSYLEFFTPIIMVDMTVGKNHGQYDLQSDQQLYAVSWNELADDNQENLNEQVKQTIFDERIYKVLNEAGLLFEIKQ